MDLPKVVRQPRPAPAPAAAAAAPKKAGAGAAKKPVAAAPKKFSEKRIDTHKAADPFASQRKHKTNFGKAYSDGFIPCHIDHGGVKQSLRWNRSPADLDYDPLLVTCFEGLSETEHPYVFVSRAMIDEMLSADGCEEKTQSLVPLLVPPLRMALMSKSTDTFRAANKALHKLSEVVGERLNSFLPNILIQLNKRLMEKGLREEVSETLQCLEEMGGDPALKSIKAKIPTYASVRR
eukprot:CAMPEP_0113882690 /NCGR_PEP_ID=MMETSP0780_2-20120614/9121_1 /TAXON_ID=652834 /ORGANISM="Palpitomonas bilix" /LENGTH=234 /DNA_ID=CAMNT_0000869785 /DNA_START=336 /DNA_END=1040 /DNA_ORIENTATION=+ /assembly_acc=CAM_ASM_000599